MKTIKRFYDEHGASLFLLLYFALLFAQFFFYPDRAELKLPEPTTYELDTTTRDAMERAMEAEFAK